MVFVMQLATFSLLGSMMLPEDRSRAPPPPSPSPTLEAPAGTETVQTTGTGPRREAPPVAAPSEPPGAADPAAEPPDGCGAARSARSRPSRASSSGSPPSAPGRPCTCSIASMSSANSAMINEVRAAGPRVESARQAATPHARPPAAAKVPRVHLPTSGTRSCREGPTHSPSCARGRPARLRHATSGIKHSPRQWSRSSDGFVKAPATAR